MTEEKLEETLTKLLVGQAEVAAEVKGLNSAFEASEKHRSVEIGALFEDRDALQRDVGKIQRSYVPRNVLEKHVDEQREDLKAFGEQIAGVKVSVAKIMAMGAALFGLAQLAAGWVGK